MENKKNMALPIKVIIIGCVIGLVVAGIGGFKQLDAKRINKERADYPLKEQYEKKQQECDAMNMSDPNWFAEHSKCQRESSDLHSKMTNLEMEDTAIKNKDYTGYYQKVKPMSYQIFYIIGASIAGLALLGAFIIYLVKGKKSY